MDQQRVDCDDEIDGDTTAAVSSKSSSSATCITCRDVASALREARVDAHSSCPRPAAAPIASGMDRLRSLAWPALPARRPRCRQCSARAPFCDALGPAVNKHVGRDAEASVRSARQARGGQCTSKAGGAPRDHRRRPRREQRRQFALHFERDLCATRRAARIARNGWCRQGPARRRSMVLRASGIRRANGLPATSVPPQNHAGSRRACSAMLWWARHGVCRWQAPGRSLDRLAIWCVQRQRPAGERFDVIRAEARCRSLKRLRTAPEREQCARLTGFGMRGIGGIRRIAPPRPRCVQAPPAHCRD